MKILMFVIVFFACMLSCNQMTTKVVSTENTKTEQGSHDAVSATENNSSLKVVSESVNETIIESTKEQNTQAISNQGEKSTNKSLDKTDPPTAKADAPCAKSVPTADSVLAPMPNVTVPAPTLAPAPTPVKTMNTNNVKIAVDNNETVVKQLSENKSESMSQVPRTDTHQK